MRIENELILTLYADNGKIIVDKNGEILGEIVYVAKSLTENDFMEIDKPLESDNVIDMEFEEIQE